MERASKKQASKKVGKYIVNVLRDSQLKVSNIGSTSDNGRKLFIKFVSMDDAALNKDQKRTIRYKLEHEIKILSYLNGATRFVVEPVACSIKDNLVYLVLEFLENGSLFNFIKRLHETKRHSENLTRGLFRNILLAVNDINRLGVSHLDLKPGNIMFGDDSTIKLVDFEHSCSTAEWPRVIRPNIGTQRYNAPETMRKLPENTTSEEIKEVYTDSKEKGYIAKSADIFSLGVILYEIHFNGRPFDKCNETDANMLLIIKEQYEEFWLKVGKQGIPASTELKKLITSMLLYEPEQRLTLNEALQSPWIRELSEEQYRELNQEISDLLVLKPSDSRIS